MHYSRRHMRVPVPNIDWQLCAGAGLALLGRMDEKFGCGFVILGSSAPDWKSAVRCAGLALLGHVDEKFTEVTDVYEPLEGGSRDK